jgi:hypothetical protein
MTVWSKKAKNVAMTCPIFVCTTEADHDTVLRDLWLKVICQ